MSELSVRSSHKTDKPDDENNNSEVHIQYEKTQLKKTVGLFNGITIIVGSVIGSGIFISPIGILKRTPSVGSSLIIWVLGGLYSLMGACCYGELGTMMQRSGADYSYVLEVFGPFLGFLRLWVEIMVVRPVSAGVIAIVFATYMIQPIFPHCDRPEVAVLILGSASILTIGFINGFSVRLTTRVQDVFTVAKLLALFGISITGFVYIGMGRTEYFEDAFDGANWSPDKLAGAMFSSLFSYSGWNYLNFVIEEMHDPTKHLVIAIVISCTLVTVVYTTANIAYMSVLSVTEILESSAVAVTFAQKVYGRAWVIMPICVALSCFGSMNGIVMTTSRLFYVGAQEGQMPDVLSFLHMKRLTPIPSIMFTCFITLIYIQMGNVDSLISYLGFVQWFAICISVFIVILLRFTRPNAKRPVRVPIVFAYVYVLFTLLLIIFSFVEAPIESISGVAIVMTGIPFYWFGCCWKNKPQSFQRKMNWMTRTSQKVFSLLPGS